MFKKNDVKRIVIHKYNCKTFKKNLEEYTYIDLITDEQRINKTFRSVLKSLKNDICFVAMVGYGLNHHYDFDERYSKKCMCPEDNNIDETFDEFTIFKSNILLNNGKRIYIGLVNNEVEEDDPDDKNIVFKKVLFNDARDKFRIFEDIDAEFLTEYIYRLRNSTQKSNIKGALLKSNIKSRSPYILIAVLDGGFKNGNYRKTMVFYIKQLNGEPMKFQKHYKYDEKSKFYTYFNNLKKGDYIYY